MAENLRSGRKQGWWRFEWQTMEIGGGAAGMMNSEGCDEEELGRRRKRRGRRFTAVDCRQSEAAPLLSPVGHATHQNNSIFQRWIHFESALSCFSKFFKLCAWCMHGAWSAGAYESFGDHTNKKIEARTHHAPMRWMHTHSVSLLPSLSLSLRSKGLV